MGNDRDEKINELAADLDDLKLTVEELQDELPVEGERKALVTLESALEEASEASDELVNRREDSTD
jgi:hypothetical protein